MDQSFSTWCIAHLEHRIEYRGFSFTELKNFVRLLPEGSESHWVVWNKGWPNWKPLSEVHTLLGSKTTLQFIPPPLPGHKVSDDPQSLTEYVERDHERFEKRFLVRIELGHNSFQTYTQNISAGGALLLDSLPDWVVGYCSTEIIKQETGESVQITSSIVENQDIKKRNRVLFVPFSEKIQEQNFYYWLAS